MKTQKYRQISAMERERLYQFLSSGDKLRSIAKALGRSVSTISREIKRNKNERVGQYLPDTAEKKRKLRNQCGRKQPYIKKDPVVKTYVLEKLAEGWSPEQIAGRMRSDIGKYLNLESIYQYIYGAEGQEEQLRFHLRRAHRIRHRKLGRKPHKGRIPDRIDISVRPASIETRQVFGHWEGDSMLFQGGRQALATQTERKSRYLVAQHVHDMTSQTRNTALSDYFKTLPPEARQSITVDNGPEFFGHTRLTQTTGIAVYFTKPYASWQKGAIENQNGLLRWYLPRQKNLLLLPPNEIDRIVHQINNRPRKCLNFQKPIEVFYNEMKKITKNQSAVALGN